VADYVEQKFGLALPTGCDFSPARDWYRDLEEVYAEKRASYGGSISPEEAYIAMQLGAFLIDVRPEHKVKDMEHGGIVPGSFRMSLDVARHRLHPNSLYRDPNIHVIYGGKIIPMCDHGYSSTNLAFDLNEFGIPSRDVAGGFQAWKAAGLPVVPFFSNEDLII
jgi:rhodanese-related sulfurtransferase